MAVKFEPIEQPVVDQLMAPIRAKYDRWRTRFEALGIPTARVRLETRTGTIVTLVETAPRENRLAVADPTDTAPRLLDVVMKGNVDARLSPDDTRLLLVIPDILVVATCSVQGGPIEEVFRAAAKRGLRDAAWLDDHRIVVAADKRLHIVDVTAGAPKTIASFDSTSPNKVHPARGGQLVFVTSSDRRADMFAVEGDALRKLGGAGGEYDGLYELDQELYTGVTWSRIAGLPAPS